MSVTAIIPFISPILKLVDKFLPDEDARMKLRSELLSQAMNAESELYKAQGSIITAEAQGESWMQRNWRPITMLTFVFIIANNYVIAPYAEFIVSLFGGTLTLPTLEIPNGMWGLLQVGIGGYIVSRGAEKITRDVQKGGKPLIGSSKDQITREDLDRDREALLSEMRALKG